MISKSITNINTVDRNDILDPFYNDVVLLIHADGKQGDSTKVYYDSSPNQFTLSSNGATTTAVVGSYSPFPINKNEPYDPDLHSGSLYINGDGGGYINTTNAFETLSVSATDKFTVECWVFPLASGVQNATISYSNPTTGSINASWYILLQSNSTVQFGYYGSPGVEIAAGAWTIGRWQHIAGVCDGSSLILYVNGINVGSVSVAGKVPTAPSSSSIVLGQFCNSTAYALSGYISNARYVKGQAIYNTNFIPPSASPVKNDVGTVFLFNGKNNTVIDNSRTVNLSVTQTLTLSAANQLRGSTALSFNGSECIKTVEYNSSLDVYNTSFTYECWVYPVGSSSGMIFFHGTNATTSGSTCYLFLNWGLGVVRGYINVGASPISLDSSNVYITNAWNHIVFQWDKTAGITSIYLNGIRTSAASTTSNLNSNPASDRLIIGRYADDSSYNFAGMMDEIRLTRKARYNTPYITPSLERYPNNYSNYTDYYTHKNLLNIHFDGLSGNSGTFFDSGQHNKTVTRTGVVIQGTPSPYYKTFEEYDSINHGGSGYFDGSTGYLSVPASGNLSLSGDFTIEGWFKYSTYTQQGAAYRRLFSFGTDATTTPQIILRNSSGTAISPAPIFYTNAFSTGGTISAADGQWHHIAVSRVGSSIRLFVDGFQSGTTATDSTNFTGGGSNGVFLGGYSNTATGLYEGYISNFRILNGAGLYTTTFTPPKYPVANIVHNSLLLNFTNGGIIDHAGNAVISAFNVTLTGSDPKYGRSSVYMNHPGSANSYLTIIPTNKDVGFGDFTIETWIRKYSVSTTSKEYIFDSRDSSGVTSTYMALGFGLLSSDGKLEFVGYSSGLPLTLRDSAAFSNLSTWTHVAVSKYKNYTRLFVNGTEVASNNDYNNYPTATNKMYIGSIYTAGSYLTAGLDDFRFTLGTSRYNSNFTPPSRSNTNISTTVRDTSAYTTLFLLDTVGLSGGHNRTITESSSYETPVSRFGSCFSTNKSPFDQNTLAINKGIWFNGNGAAYISVVPRETILDKSSFTVEFYCNIDSAEYAGGRYVKLFCCDSNGAAIYKLNSGLSLRSFIAGSGDAYHTYNFPLSNTWAHVAMVKDNNVLNLYVNGIKGNVSASTSNQAAEGTWYFGYDPASPAQNYKGFLSNIRISRTALYRENFEPPKFIEKNENTIFLMTGDLGYTDSVYNVPVTPNGPVALSSLSGVYTNRYIHPSYHYKHDNTSYNTQTFGGSIWFPGTDTDYLSCSIPASQTFQDQTNWTIDYWFNYDSADMYNNKYVCFFGTNNGNLIAKNKGIGFGGANPNYLYGLFPTPTQTGMITSLSADTWNHVAYVKNGTNLRLYVNGVYTQQNTVTTSTAETTLTIGRRTDSGGGNANQGYKGYISNFRISRRAIWTSNFTPTFAPISSESSVICFKGDDAKIIDATGNNGILSYGTTVTDNNYQLFNKNAVKFNGNGGVTGDYLTIPSNTLINSILNNNANFPPFTIEAWVYPLYHFNSNRRVATYGVPNSIATTNLHFNMMILSSGLLQFNTYSGGVQKNSCSTAVVSTSAWSHIAGVYDGAKLNVYVNGLGVVGDTFTGSSQNIPTAQLFMGLASNYTDALTGYIQDARLSYGARYNGNFNPPTRPLPRF